MFFNEYVKECNFPESPNSPFQKGYTATNLQSPVVYMLWSSGDPTETSPKGQSLHHFRSTCCVLKGLPTEMTTLEALNVSDLPKQAANPLVPTTENMQMTLKRHCLKRNIVLGIFWNLLTEMILANSERKEGEQINTVDP